jgi:hypothetical protein
MDPHDSQPILVSIPRRHLLTIKSALHLAASSPVFPADSRKELADALGAIAEIDQLRALRMAAADELASLLESALSWMRTLRFFGSDAEGLEADIMKVQSLLGRLK